MGLEEDEIEIVASAATDSTLLRSRLGSWRVRGRGFGHDLHEAKRVTLFDGGHSDIPTNAREVVKWLNALIEKAPAEYRDAVVLDLDHSEYSCSLDVYYTIPLTPEQEAENEALEAAREAAERAQWEADERRVFESLKAKYGT